MKQYGVADSWTKLFSIDITSSLLEVCGVLESEEEILVAVKQWSDYRHIKSLVSYDPKTKQMNHIREIQNKHSVDYFVETLALLGVKTESFEPLESENPAVSKQSPYVQAKRKRTEVFAVMRMPDSVGPGRLQSCSDNVSLYSENPLC